MNSSIIALLVFGIAVVCIIVLEIALLIVIIIRAQFPGGSDGDLL